METSTGELIAKLTNLSNKLDGEMRFAESDTVLKAVALIMVQVNSVERLRHSSQADYTDIRQVAQFISEQTYE